MTDGYRVQEYTAWRELVACAPEIAAAEASDPFFTAQWFELLAAHGFDPAARLRLLVARDRTGRPRLALPLAGGQSITALSNFYSCLYSPLVVGSPIDSAALDALCRHLKTAPGGAAVVRLAPLDPQGDFALPMLAALRRAGFWADTYFCFGNWILAVGGRSYEAYLATLPGQLRTTLTRRARRLEREGASKVSIHTAPGPDLENAITDFVAVYQASWKDPEPHPRFIPELCRTAAKLGWLRLGILALDGRALAVQLWLHCAGRSMIYKLAYDEAFAHFSAGSLLTAALMQNAINNDHATEIDYLSGDEAYKRDWMSHRRERIGIVAFNPRSLRGLAAAAHHFAGKRARRGAAGAAHRSAPAVAAQRR